MIPLVGYEGKQLSNYRLVRFLGRGGFAVVYLGEHVHLGTRAAIKMLHVQMSPQDLQRFTEEAKTISRLSHPHIIRLLDFGVEDTVTYLIMEYAAQGTLRDRHPHGARVPLPQVVDYVQQVGAALQYAHEQGVVHRDIKPENMLVNAQGSLVLSDFGLAIPVHRTLSLSTQEPVGSIPYMSPEQIHGKARPASDQYALAVVIYEWLSGTQPFEGSTSIEVAMKHLNQPPPPIRPHLPSLPLSVEQVLQQALAKEPQDRFRSVLDFAQALEQASKEGAAVVDLSFPTHGQPPRNTDAMILPGASSSEDTMPSSQSSHLYHSLAEPPQSDHSRQRVPLLHWLSFAGLGVLVLGLLLASLYGPTWVRPIPVSTHPPIQQKESTFTATQLSPAQTPSPQAVYTRYTSGPPTQSDPLLDGSTWQWFDNAPAFGTCVFTRGAYHVAPAYKGAFASCNASNERFDTFAYQVQVTIQKGDAAGLIVNYQPTTPYRTFDGFLFCRDTGKFCVPGSVWFTHAQAGGSNCQTSTHFNCDTTYPFINTSPGGQNTLTIIVLSQTIYLYINGHSVGVVPRVYLGQGGIGVVTYEDSNSTDATFSHAKLWVLPG